MNKISRKKRKHFRVKLTHKIDIMPLPHLRPFHMNLWGTIQGWKTGRACRILMPLLNVTEYHIPSGISSHGTQNQGCFSHTGVHYWMGWVWTCPWISAGTDERSILTERDVTWGWVLMLILLLSFYGWLNLLSRNVTLNMHANPSFFPNAHCCWELWDYCEGTSSKECWETDVRI